MNFEFSNSQFFEYKSEDSDKLYESVWLYDDDLNTGFGILVEVANEMDLETVLDICIMNLRKSFFVEPKPDPLETMQSALHDLNKNLEELPLNLGLNLEDLHLAIVYLDKTKVYISKYNQAAVYIWRQRQLIAVSEMIDEDKKNLDLTGFSEIVSGTYKYADQLILTSRRLTKFHDLSRWLDLLQQDMLLDEKIILDFIRGEDLAIMKTKIQMSQYVVEGLSKSKKEWFQYFKNINFKEKRVILPVLLILILLASISGYFSYNTVLSDKNVAAYQDILDEVEVIINNAKIEPDKKRVIFILSTAEDKLNEVIQEKVLLKQAKSHKIAIADIRSKIDKVEKFAPSLLMDLTEVESFVKIRGFFKSSGDFLALSKSAIYKNLPGLFPEKLLDLTEEITEFAHNPRIQALLYYDGEFFKSLNYFNSAKVYTLHTPDLTFEPSNMQIYGSRLYVLDKEANKILRANLFNSGVSDFSFYLRGLDYELPKMVDFTVDGAIYVAFEDASIQKFYKSKLDTSFRIKSQPLEVIKKIDQLYTSLDHSFLYVLEKDKNRVIQYYKDAAGNLDYDRQYYFDIEGKVSDMYVDYNQKLMYLATESRILQVPLKYID